MAISDKKKVQTMVNRVGIAAQQARDAVSVMKATRTLFNAVNPDRAGTVLAGAAAATLSSAIDALDTELAKAVWTSAINAVVPSHEGKALD